MFENWQKVLSPGNIERLLIGDLLNTGQVGGLLLTIILGFLAIVIATILGILIALIRNSGLRVLRWPAMFYINLFRSIPVLVIIFWVYFIPPVLFKVTFSAFASALIALSLFTSAYIAEIVRSGLNAVSVHQVNAGRALGFSRRQIYWYLVVPQAVFIMMPALLGRYVVTIKNTSLAFLIGLAELTEIGKQINSRLMTAPVEVYALILVLYYIVNSTIDWFMTLMERRDVFNKFIRRFI